MLERIVLYLMRRLRCLKVSLLSAFLLVFSRLQGGGSRAGRLTVALPAASAGSPWVSARAQAQAPCGGSASAFWDNQWPMTPARKRTVRLVVALSAAVILASALIYTSFSAASPAVTPSQLVREAVSGREYQLTGVVRAGSVRHQGQTLYFTVQDRAGETAVPVAYTGQVPDPFKEGREVIVTVRKPVAGSGAYVGVRDTLITKCPSKYKVAPSKAKPY